MADIKYNNSLEKIIDFAKSRLKGENASLTAERFIISVMLAAFEDENVFEQDERQIVHQALIDHFPFDSVGYKKIKDCFFEKLDKESYLDSLYMQQRIIEAQDFAKKKGMEQLTTYVLLMSIFERPNENIAKCMKGQQTSDENSATSGATSDEYNGGLIWDFDHATSNDGTDTADATSEPVDPKGVIVKLTEKVKNIYDQLVQTVFGQDNAVNVFTTGYFQSELLAMTDKNRTRPRATFLFAGPPGVGKTFLAEKAAEVLGLPFKRFDMSEYSDKEANLEFCGMDSAYKNAKEGNVTSFVAKNPKCILLFDEIEKAHINVIHLFLQLLDAGRLRDNNTDKEVSFSDAIIIFTTNAGKQIYEDSDAVDFSGLSRKVILKALQKDVNARTGVPFFPAAICSRFASGNVVMFNHISAHNLREIAKREVQRHANNFEKEIGIKVNIDERVYTSLLFAEGGAADARAIRSRAETFFDDELFELFRLLDSDSVNGKIEELDSINIKVELPCDNKEIYNLFERDDMHEALVFSSKQVCDLCVDKSSKVRFVGAQDVETAKNLINSHDISFALVDLSYGVTLDGKYLNIEDVDSKSRDFLGFVKKYHAEIPVYLLQSSEKELNTEEQISFMRQGIRGIITLSSTAEEFDSEICDVTEMLHQQKSMMNLAKANKAVTFETAQSVCNDGKTAEIVLFDFKLSVAIEAEDSKSILSSVSKPNVRFEQVIGAEDAKKELQYFVEYLKNPKKYLGTGVSAPKGVILYGPPGTGKTMLAKAMASESDVTFIVAEGNQFLKKYVGEGPEKVHELFLTARKYAPSILFIDEIDAIAKERTGGENTSGAEATLTAFLAEMDGFKNDASKPVFVLAATNFDVEPGGQKSLDPALMRRFDRRVYIDLPNRDERIRYIKLKLNEKSAFELTEDMINNIALRSTGMSLAQLQSVIELSLRTTIRSGSMKVTDDIFEEAFETFNGGETKKWDALLLERVARHESGHAFLCWQSGETPSYVTIVARGDHGGYMQHDDREGKAIYTKDELLSYIRTSLGGRAAEIVYYGEKDGVSTGASSDLESATNTARNIICKYGMDDAFGLSVIDYRSAVSGELSDEVRSAVNKILADEMQQAIKLISDNKPAIDALVEQLMSKNHLTGNEIKEIFENNCKDK